ncbi:MAG: magnesium-protoporphyrin IX monomethyl ester cyclase, partial [Brevundimonas sp.]|nr:magnesium-protoporphyrin IX monomethyl ester cyclase [Brevundimonas sp.]
VIEVICQTRPRALGRLIWHPDSKIRHAIRWYYRMGRRVWFHEIMGFLFRDRRTTDGRTVADHFGAVQDHEEQASAIPPRRPRLVAAVPGPKAP